MQYAALAFNPALITPSEHTNNGRIPKLRDACHEFTIGFRFRFGLYNLRISVTESSNCLVSFTQGVAQSTQDTLFPHSVYNLYMRHGVCSLGGIGWSYTFITCTFSLWRRFSVSCCALFSNVVKNV